MRILAIIPARGGSKGVPGKNLRVLAGKPLLVHSVEQALAARSVTDTVISTDDPAIAQVAADAGAAVPFLRPGALATDEASTEPVMRHALLEMERHVGGTYDAVLLLQPTSPLRLADTVDRAVAVLQDSGADSLCSVVESHAFFWQDGEPPRASYDPANRPRRQDISAADRRWRETGSIYLTRRDPFLAENNRLAGRIVLFPTDEGEGWEIDSLADFAILDALMTMRTPQ